MIENFNINNFNSWIKDYFIEVRTQFVGLKINSNIYQKEVSNLLVQLDAFNFNDKKSEFNLWNSINRLTDLLFLQKNKLEFEVSIIHFEAGVQIANKLLQNASSNEKWQFNLFVSLNKLGDALLKAEKPENSLIYYKSAMLIANNQMHANSENSDWTHRVAMSYEKIAELENYFDEFEMAQKNYEICLMIRQKLQSKEPNNKIFRVEIWQCINKIASFLNRFNKIEESINYFQNGLSLGKELVINYPDDTFIKYDIWQCHFKLSNIYFSKNNLNKSLEQAIFSLSLAEEILQLKLGEVNAQRNCMMSHLMIEKILKNLNKTDKAEIHNRKAYEIGTILAKNFLNNNNPKIIFNN